MKAATTVKDGAPLRYHMVELAGTKAMLALKLFFLHKFYSQKL